MYEDDGIERWRRGDRRRYPGERAAAVYSAPSASVSSSMSASHSSKSQRPLSASHSSKSQRPLSASHSSKSHRSIPASHSSKSQRSMSASYSSKSQRSMPASHSSKSQRSMPISQSNRSQSSLRSSSSSHSWKSRCRRTGEFCAEGHELVQIPVLDRQQYLRRKQMQEEQQEQQQGMMHPFDPPAGVCPPATQGSYSGPIEIECDCCSGIIGKDQNIAGCCLECDIDLCENCFKNGQSYIDVVLKESRQDDMYDERHEQMKEENHLHHQRHNGVRPTYMGTGRVNYDHYPDPTVFQWSFTGSNCDDPDAIAPVEYFEKDFGKAVGVIRLDFYYTIGTVQTTIVDPIRGTIKELFTKSPHKMSQKSYRKILKDPRSYTNERYKKGSSKAIDLRQQVL